MERLDKIEDERRQMLEETRLESQEQLQELQAEMAEVRKALARARQPVDALDAAAEAIEVLEDAVEEPVTRQEPQLGEKLERIQAERKRAIRLGDKVQLRSLGTKGVVSALSEDEAEVQVGMLRVRARLSDLELAGGGEQTSIKPRSSARIKRAKSSSDVSATSSSIYHESPGVELDLRGRRADEALDALDGYLDNAFLAGLPYVRIIHGKGTGKLRQVVRKALSTHQHVRSYEAGGNKEGGDGVTVAKLKTE
jgi:DNA mismatch repair protein MutS2